MRVYEGVDRTQGAGYNGYFGDDIDNISSLKIVRGSDGWKNYAIIGGQGEGVNRKIVTASLGAYTGDDLRELWVDAKDIGTTYQIAAPDGSGGYTYTEATYTDEEYAAVLQARGLEKLAEENLQTLEVDASIGQGLMGMAETTRSAISCPQAHPVRPTAVRAYFGCSHYLREYRQKRLLRCSRTSTLQRRL